MRSVQRFQPLVVASNDDGSANTFIPRQRLFLCYVSTKRVFCYTYNCSRDIVERLEKHIKQIGHWYNARSAAVITIVNHKLGIFYNEAFYRQKPRPNINIKRKPSVVPSNPFLGNDSYLDPLLQNAVSFCPSSNATTSKTYMKWEEDAFRKVVKSYLLDLKMWGFFFIFQYYSYMFRCLAIGDHQYQ